MNDNDDLLWRHLKRVPAFRALLRSVEARIIRRKLIQEPILDLGCGDGLFAKFAFSSPLTAGIDPWWDPLLKAKRNGAHSLLIHCTGERLPFPDRSFGSVVSNSVLEHIADVGAVLQECQRVLVPGGKLYMTVPGSYFSERLAGAQWLERLGLPRFADSYRDLFNQIARHEHVDPPQKWARRLQDAGLVVDSWHYYFSTSALHALEIGHFIGVPSAIIHSLSGHWILAPWKSNLRLTERWVRPHYEEIPSGIGTMIFLVAANEEPENGKVLLPEQEKIMEWHEFRPTGVEEDLTEPDTVPPPAIAVEESADVIESYRGAPATDGTASPERARKPAGNTFTVLIALLCTALGLALLRQESPNVLAAIVLLIIGLAGLVGNMRLAKILAAGITASSNLIRRRWLVLVGVALSIMATRLVNNPAVLPRTGLAITVWLLAIFLTGLAFWKSDADTGNTTTNRKQIFSSTLLSLLLFIVAAIIRLIDLNGHPFVLSGEEASVGLDALSIANGHIGSPFATAWLTTPTLPLFLHAIPLRFSDPSIFAVRLLPALIGAVTVPAIYLVAAKMWGRVVGWVAALLLLGSHVHLHYSRQGLTTVWDPLLMLLVVGLLYWGWQSGRRHVWILAGLVAGMGAYLFASARLLPLFAIPVILLAYRRRQELRQQNQNLAAAGFMALVSGLPQILYYANYPGIYWDRVQATSIFHRSWLVQESMRTGSSIGRLLVDQIWRGGLSLIRSADTSISYNSGKPILGFWQVLFLLIGLALIVRHRRQVRSQLTLWWILLASLLFGVVTIQPPASHLLLIALPVAIMLSSLGLVWTGRHLGRSLGVSHFYATFITLSLAGILTAGELFFYFGQYRAESSFGDRNTEFAYRASQYINDLDGRWNVNLVGAPSVYTSFPTFSFLVEGWQEDIVAVDVPVDVPLPMPSASENTLYLILPERSQEIVPLQDNVPNGILATFDGSHASPLFFAYEVR